MPQLQRRKIRYAHLSEAVEDVRQLADCGYDRAGTWSLEQNLNHLNKTLRIAFEPPDWGFPRLIRPIIRWLAMGRMERLGSSAFGKSAKAPGALLPDDSLDLEFEIAEFERLTQWIESSDAVLLPEHPVLGRLKRNQWQIVNRWHCAHHLSHLILRSR